MQSAWGEAGGGRGGAEQRRDRSPPPTLCQVPGGRGLRRPSPPPPAPSLAKKSQIYVGGGTVKIEGADRAPPARQIHTWGGGRPGRMENNKTAPSTSLKLREWLVTCVLAPATVWPCPQFRRRLAAPKFANCFSAS